MLLTDWLKLLCASGLSLRAPSRPTRRQGSSVVNSADVSSQPETLEKRTLLSAANILLTDVAGVTGFQVTGASLGNTNFGNSIRAAGDVNGDGLDDVIIGAYYESQLAGTAYVLFGKSTGFSPPPDLDLLQASEGFRILGTNGNDAATAVSGGGDINGDGFDDLVVAAPNYTRAALEDNTISSGYVIFGKANNTDVQLSDIDAGADDSIGFRLTGFTNTLYQASDSASTGGDINGDGFDDVVFGGKFTKFGTNYIGAAYVVFGKESGFANLDITDLNGTTGFSFTDSARGYDSTNAYIGAAVSISGDVNGDGFDDLLVGAPGQNKYRGSMEYDGEAYVVFGRADFSANSTIQVTSLDGTNGFVAEGLSGQQARTGSSVSSGGDVNGDGIDDLIIGAPGDDEGYGSAAGRAYVVFGKTGLGSSGSLDLVNLSGSNGFELTGGSAYDLAGTSVSITGDLNGDGFDDIVVGAPSTEGPTPSEDAHNGAAYVIFGDSSISVPSNLDAVIGVNGFALLGTSGHVAGKAVALVGDLDGDGFDELLIGEPYSSRGTVTFFFGTDFLLNNGISGDGELGNGLQKIDGSSAGSLTANAGAGAADILVGGGGNDTLNADGGSDVLIGGSGDDTLVAKLSNFSNGLRFDGGTGVDILTGDASFSGATINLTTIPGNRINDIEVIDLEDAVTETLTLDLATVLAITGAGTTIASSSPFATNDAHTLAILRDGDDTINIGAGWTQGANEMIDGKTFEVFTQDGATVKIQSANVSTGNIDGDADFDTNDSFLINIILLGGSDSLIDSSKGASPLTAQEIRDGLAALIASGALDVDGDGDSESNDSFLINIIKLGASQTQVNSSKGASPLTATQIMANVAALTPPAARPQSPTAAPEESTVLPPPEVPSFQAAPQQNQSEPILPEIPSAPTLPPGSLMLTDQSPAVQESSGDDLADVARNDAQDDIVSDTAFAANQIDVTMDLLS